MDFLNHQFPAHWMNRYADQQIPGPQLDFFLVGILQGKNLYTASRGRGKIE